MSFIREVTLPTLLCWAILWGIFISMAIVIVPREIVFVIIGGAVASLLYIVIITIIGLYND